MSEKRAILRKPHWSTLAGRPGVSSLPVAVLKAADSFLDYRATHRIAAPTPHHFAAWAEGQQPPRDALIRLGKAMALIAPVLVPQIREAEDLLMARLSPPTPAPVTPEADPERRAARRKPASQPARLWDPIAPPSRRPPVPRRVSVEPWELLPEWQAALRRMARGFPQNGAPAPAESIVKRMREKLCQMSWSAHRAGLPISLSESVLMRYETDLRARCAEKDHGIRWATVRASIEEIGRFARYTGACEEFVALCRFRLQRLTAFEDGQRALKFYELERTGHTTLGLLDLADEILSEAPGEKDAKRRHLLRNRAAILGIYTVAPLRNASADLVLGKTLFWEGNEWVIDTEIQKTHARNPEKFVYPLEPQHGKFIDAVLLGDQDPSRLPALRAAAQTAKRPLFVHFGGERVGTTYIARLFKEITDNSFTTLRTMLHTDLGVAYGVAGTEMAMVAAHQTSQKVANKYKAEIVARTAAGRAQERVRRRRQRYFTDESVG
ncbi:hypothetical protein ACRDNQ_02155 [Palleronia sp. KMU-117]|uniref:hypothetical protein n=1 Tax=Palleronia sp. KMU-117 TaxID=3434108 RepID=UPI003D723BBE